MSDTYPNVARLPEGTASAILESIADGVYALDRAYRFTLFNDRCERYFGLPREEVLGRAYLDVFPTAKGSDIEAALVGAMTSGEARQLETVSLITHVPILLRAFPSAEGLTIVFTDVSDRHRAEQESRRLETEQRCREAELASLATESERQRRLYDTVLSNTPDLVYVWGLDHRFVYANASLLGMWGKTWDEAIGKHCLELGYEPWHAEMHDREIDQVVATKRPVRGVVPFAGAYGRRMYDYILVPVIGENGDVEAVAGTTRDVTDLIEVENALRRSDERLKDALEAGRMAYWTWDAEADRIEASETIDDLFGLPLGESLRNSLQGMGVVHPEDAMAHRTLIDECLRKREGWHTEFRVVRPRDGKVAWLEERAHVPPERGAVTGLVWDITTRKEAEQALRESEEQFRTVFQEATDDAILLMDAERRLLAWNTGAERICGWSAREAIGQSGDIIFKAEDREESVPQEEAMNAAKDGKTPNERWHVRKDGSLFWGSGTMNALCNADGTVRGYLKVFRDATARHEVERKAGEIRAELERMVTERTQALEEAVREAEGFNYSIAHDLRSPLRAIVSTASILLEEAGPGLEDEHRIMLERQVRNANRLGTLIDELLRLSRLARAQVNRQPLDMTRKAREVAEVERAERPCQIEVQEGMTAEGDPGLIRTLLHNLIGNACKFSPQGGVVRVGQTGDTFWVEDEGVGFDMAYATKLFLPFERLVREDEFPGTGIGLANVERIVRRHGGRVWAESEGVGKGATFFFTLREHINKD